MALSPDVHLPAQAGPPTPFARDLRIIDEKARKVHSSTIGPTSKGTPVCDASRLQRRGEGCDLRQGKATDYLEDRPKVASAVAHSRKTVARRALGGWSRSGEGERCGARWCRGLGWGGARFRKDNGRACFARGPVGKASGRSPQAQGARGRGSGGCTTSGSEAGRQGRPPRYRTSTIQVSRRSPARAPDS
jgi:hypothetical protein